MVDTMKIPAFMRLQSEVVELRAATTEDATGTRPFAMKAYTGAEVKMAPFGRLIINLAGIKVRSEQMPILLSHNNDKPVGYATSAEVVDGVFMVDGQIIPGFPAAKTVLEGAAAKFKWQGSIGVQFDKAEYVEAGDSRSVNGALFKGPGVHVSESTVIETSFTPAGADGNTTATVFARADEAAGEIEVTRSNNMSDTDNNKGQMSAEDIEKQKAAAAEEAARAERAKLAALKAAFPDRVAFATEQFEKGHTVEQAKAALADVLAAELTAANAKVAELQKTHDEMAGKLASFEDGSAGAGLEKKGEGGTGGKEAYDGDWENTRLSAEELAEQHWQKNFNGCREEFGENGFHNYAQFVAEERRQLALN